MDTNIEREHLIELLRSHFAAEVLDGEGDDLDADTPLLKYGIINSISIVGMVAFFEKRFGVEVPAHIWSPADLQNLGTIADSFLEIYRQAGSQPGD